MKPKIKAIQGADDTLRTAIDQLAEGQLPTGWQWVDSSVNARVARYQPAGQAALYYYKEFFPRNSMESIKAVVRGSRCKRAIKQSDLLLSKGFLAPKTLCSGALINGNEFMVSEAVQGFGVHDYITGQLAAMPKASRIAATTTLMQNLGAEIGRLHRAGFVHGDLRPNNVMLAPANGEQRFIFIDNERTREYTRIPQKLVEKNLVQINMIRAEQLSLGNRLRFFEAYCAHYPRYTEMEQRQLACTVHQRTQERLSKKAQSREQ